MGCTSNNATPPGPAVAPGAEDIDPRRVAERLALEHGPGGMDPRVAAFVPGFDAPFFQAGLAGYSDAAMRIVARRHGCPYCVTEALLDRTLLAGGRGFAKADLRVAPASPGKAERLRPFLTRTRGTLYVNLEEAGILCQAEFSDSETAAKAMLDRGFTAVRDTGGADYGLWMAIERGLIVAPRLFYCEKALSQTGGHVDFRHHHEHHPHDEHAVLCGCCFTNPLGVVVDGVDAVRRVIREQLRRGASFIKFCGSGGVSSVSDPLDGIQFSNDEVRAIVEEVENHLVYCTAHIHPDRALRRAIELGVHCIEHGTLIEQDTANMAADRGTSIVPTLAVIAGLSERGEEFGYPRESLDKLVRIKDEAIGRLEHMKRAGVRIGFGTDLIGGIQPMQCIEFGLRANVFSNVEILRQATTVNAEIIGAKGEIGEVSAGALADLLVVDGNPLEDLSLMENDGASIPVVMKGGRFHRNRLAA